MRKPWWIEKTNFRLSKLEVQALRERRERDRDLRRRSIETFTSLPGIARGGRASTAHT